MSILLERKKDIKSIGGLRIQAKDAVFIIKDCRSVHWGKYLTFYNKRTVWYDYEALIVVTNLKVMKLVWVDGHSKPTYDKIVDQVRKRKIKSMLDLYSEIGKHSDRNGAPVRLAETKLEYFYD